MTVLLLTTEYPPARGYGLARYSWELARALSASGMTTHVLTRNSGPDITGGPGRGPYVHNMRQAFPLKHFDWVGDMVLANVPMLEHGLEVAEKHGPFDTIISNDWLCAHAAKSLGSILGIPWLLIMHDTEAGKRGGKLTPQQKYISEMDTWACGHADHVMTTSSFMRDELQRVCGVPPEKLTVVPCGLDPEPFRSATDVADFRKLLSGEEGKLLVYVGRLSPMKGVEDLAHAFVALARGRRDVSLVLASEGVLRDPLGKMFEDARLSGRVHFVGWLSSKVLGVLYRAADVIVVPSRYEPFGMVALEAASCGATVVASRTGGLGEIVERSDDSMMAVHARSPTDLEDALTSLLNDSGRARAMGARAREHVVETYTWQKTARQVSDILESLVRRQTAKACR